MIEKGLKIYIGTELVSAFLNTKHFVSGWNYLVIVWGKIPHDEQEYQILVHLKRLVIAMPILCQSYCQWMVDANASNLICYWTLRGEVSLLRCYLILFVSFCSDCQRTIQEMLYNPFIIKLPCFCYSESISTNSVVLIFLFGIYLQNTSILKISAYLTLAKSLYDVSFSLVLSHL